MDDQWILTDTLYYSAKGSILATTDPNWVIKRVRKKREIDVAISVNLVGPRAAVIFPAEAKAFFGKDWYAMRRYDDHLRCDNFCRAAWRLIGIRVIQFLQDFHHGLGLVHGDIKKANILVDFSNNDFVVCDYECAHRPHPDALFLYNDDFKWYYVSLGIDLDAPPFAWRADLVMLAYLLASLCETTPWTFEEECWTRRDGPTKLALSDAELVLMRDKEFNATCVREPALLAYMNSVSQLPWRSDDPPPRSFYVALEGLLG